MTSNGASQWLADLGIAIGVPWALAALLVLPVVWWLRQTVRAVKLFPARQAVLMLTRSATRWAKKSAHAKAFPRCSVSALRRYYLASGLCFRIEPKKSDTGLFVV